MPNQQQNVNPYQAPAVPDRRGHLFHVALVAAGVGLTLMSILAAVSLWMVFYGFNSSFWLEQFELTAVGIVVSLAGMAIAELGRRRHRRRGSLGGPRSTRRGG